MGDIIETLQEFNIISIAVRLLLSTIIGGIIGNERGKHGSAAGLRTHILVCIGATMTSLTGLYAFHSLNASDDIIYGFYTEKNHVVVRYFHNQKLTDKILYTCMNEDDAIDLLIEMT